MRLFPRHESIQQLGCDALMLLCAASEPHAQLLSQAQAQALICKHGALEVLLGTVRHCISNEIRAATGLQLSAVGLLMTLSETEEVQRQLIDLGAVSDLLKAKDMVANVDDKQDLRYNLGMIVANLIGCVEETAENDGSASDLVEGGGVACLVDVLSLQTSRGCEAHMASTVTTSLLGL